MSALRLATGFQRVSGGPIFCLDTESRRALHYSDQFTFQHVPFGAPFSPTDYLEAIQHCVKRGARHIIIDSFSHEWDGVGGVLEMQEAEVQRLSRGDASKADKIKMLAWVKPKMSHRRLINTMLQIDANFICCFRSKQKIKVKKGEDPESLGFLPVSGDDLVYEMTLKCLLLPGADGVPTVQSELAGERMMIKTPLQFRSLFSQAKQLSEDTGEALAKWAAGAAVKGPVDVTDLARQYAACADPATFRTLEETRRAAWASIGKEGKALLKTAADAATSRMEQASAPPESEPAGREPGDDEV